MLALNISAAMPALLKPRFSSPAAAFMRTVLLCVICLFPIVPDFVQTFLLSFAAFLIYIFVFYDEGTEKTAAFSVIFFSIIGSWSYLTTWWIQRISSSALPLWLPPVVALLLTALALLYFSILRAYFRIVSESMVLGSFTERMWNYATFMAASPSVLILTLVVSPPRNLLILQLLTFFAIAASTIIFPMLYQMGRSARLAEENSRLRARSEYYQGVESQQQEIRKLKHDLMNHLTVIATYIDLGENEKAMEYLKEIGTRFAEMTKQYTPSTLINAILNSKKQKADAHGLEMAQGVQGDPGEPGPGGADISRLNRQHQELCLYHAVVAVFQLRPEHFRIKGAYPVEGVPLGGNLDPFPEIRPVHLPAHKGQLHADRGIMGVIHIT